MLFCDDDGVPRLVQRWTSPRPAYNGKMEIEVEDFTGRVFLVDGLIPMSVLVRFHEWCYSDHPYPVNMVTVALEETAAKWWSGIGERE